MVAVMGATGRATRTQPKAEAIDFFHSWATSRNHDTGARQGSSNSSNSSNSSIASIPSMYSNVHDVTV